MQLTYYPDTDSLYIDLSHRPSVESREISEGVVLDYDASGHVVGIDIDRACRVTEVGGIGQRFQPKEHQVLVLG